MGVPVSRFNEGCALSVKKRYAGKVSSNRGPYRIWKLISIRVAFRRRINVRTRFVDANQRMRTHQLLKTCGFATVMSALGRWHNARRKSHGENGCERPKAMLALRRNYVLARPRWCHPLRPVLTAACPLPYRPATASGPSATLAAYAGDALHPAPTQGGIVPPHVEIRT